MSDEGDGDDPRRIWPFGLGHVYADTTHVMPDDMSIPRRAPSLGGYLKIRPS
jgi:hypothetical protein